uniref:Putative secreted protein n=1 Tax=Ixodes ricinus TaxID=34613 RepID=A0A6B0V053_IXORI
MALLRDGSFCSAVLILVSAFVSKERNVARCLGPLGGLLRLFARQPSSRLEDLSRLGLACHDFIRLGCVLLCARPRVVSHGKTSHILCVCISRVTRCKSGRESIAFSHKMLGFPGVFIAASGNIVSGNAEAMPLPKPSLLPLNLPQVAFSRRMLPWLSFPINGQQQPRVGIPAHSLPTNQPFCLAIAETA